MTKKAGAIVTYKDMERITKQSEGPDECLALLNAHILRRLKTKPGLSWLRANGVKP